MRVLDLFSGIGGFSLGLERAGMETVAFCEIEKFPRKVLKKHWSGIPIYEDIKELTVERLQTDGIGPIELVCGGFPCQPFSQAGKRGGFQDDRDLWPEMFRLIQEVRSAWVLGENVAGFVNMGLDRTISDLEGAGYGVQTLIIPACAVGAPHQRNRVWIVAHCQDARIIGRERFTGNDAIKISKRRGVGGNGNGNVGSEAVAHAAKPRCKTRGGGKQKLGLQYVAESDWWKFEPNVGRVAHGVSQRVDRLKGLGNAVVPQVVEVIGRAIMEINHERS